MPLWKSARFSIKKVTTKAQGVASVCCEQKRSSSEAVGCFELGFVAYVNSVCEHCYPYNKASNKDNHHINSGVRMELIIVNINATASHNHILFTQFYKSLSVMISVTAHIQNAVQEPLTSSEYDTASPGTVTPVTQWRGFRLPCHYQLNENTLVSFALFRLVYRGMFGNGQISAKQLVATEMVQKRNTLVTVHC